MADFSKDAALNVYQTIFEVIDMRSFSNLWYWIALAVIWSTASHFVLGVPFDLVLRAKRNGGQVAQDVADLVRINTNRILYIAQVSGLWLIGFGCAFLTVLGLLGFVYDIEFAQALFLLAFPMSIVGVISVSTSALISGAQLEGEALYRQLRRHRLYTQIVGMCSILITAMWGMYQNLVYGPFG